jgi:hypothetical protein
VCHLQSSHFGVVDLAQLAFSCLPPLAHSFEVGVKLRKLAAQAVDLQSQTARTQSSQSGRQPVPSSRVLCNDQRLFYQH